MDVARQYDVLAEQATEAERRWKTAAIARVR